jgi:hypothetical protein
MSTTESIRNYLDRFNGVRDGPRAVSNVPAGSGLSDTMTFSYVANSGVAGVSFGNGNDLANFIHRAGLPLTYFGIVYSGDPETEYAIVIQDSEGMELAHVLLPRPEALGVKRLHEVALPNITTPASRLLRVVVKTDPIVKRILVYTIMLGYN